MLYVICCMLLLFLLNSCCEKNYETVKMKDVNENEIKKIIKHWKNQLKKNKLQIIMEKKSETTDIFIKCKL